MFGGASSISLTEESCEERKTLYSIDHNKCGFRGDAPAVVKAPNESRIYNMIVGKEIFKVIKRTLLVNQ